MRVAWLVDEHTPAALIPDLIGYCAALARSGHKVEVFGPGERPEWLPDVLAYHPVNSLRAAPEPLWNCDAVIGTHWSHAGACVDVGTAAPFFLVAEAPGDDVARTARSLRINVLATSEEVACQLRTAGVRGEIHVVPAGGNSSATARLSTRSGSLEEILVGVVREHRAHVPDQVTLGLAMIVRDEQESLRRCLASVASIVDQMVVVDTGSRDGTASVARDAGAVVIRREWQNDFAAARNVALESVTTDWVLVLDADEQVVPSSGPLIRRAIKNPLVDGFLLDILNFTGDVTISGGAAHANVRLFRRLPGVRYEGALHEQVGLSLRRAGGVIRPLPGALIIHYGYLGCTVEGYDKKRRNLEIVERQAEEDPQNPFVHFNLAVEYMREGNRPRAIKVFQRAFRLLSDYEVTYAPVLVRHLAACLIDERRYDEALAVLEHAQWVYADYVDLRYLQGVALNRLGRYEEALEILSECLRIGDSPGVYMFSQIGAGSFFARAASVESYLGLGRLDEAIEAQNAAVKEMSERLGEILPALPDSGRGAFGLWVRAEEHVRRGHLREALTAYRQLQSPEVRQVFLTTQLAQLWPRKAVLELVAGEIGLARQDLDLLAGVNPRAARAARLLLAPWLTAAGEAGTGENTASEETSAGGDSRLRWRDVASVLVTLLDVGRQDWFERACDALRSGLMDPGELDRELGKLYFHRGLREEAAAHLLAGIQQGCTDSVALRALGEISLARGLHGDARTFFREAVRREPRDARAWLSLALSYHRAGHDRAALRVLELAGRQTGGEAIHTARLALRIHLQLNQGDGSRARSRASSQVAGEVDW